MQDSKHTAIEAVASFLKERDENVLPGEADDEERKASAQCIVRVVAKFSSPTNLENAERAEMETFSPPFSYVPIPLDEEGQGPADDVDAVSVVHDVWDANCVTVATCSNEEAARSVAALMNAGSGTQREGTDMTDTLTELLGKLEKLPKTDRGISWERRNWQDREQLNVYGETASLCKWVLDNSEALASRIRSCLLDKPEAGEGVAVDGWHDGAPGRPWAEEWFIAETTWGDRVVLTALPEEWTYDFKTADDTYIKADKIKRWMQFPDSQYIAPTPADTDAAAPVTEPIAWLCSGEGEGWKQDNRITFDREEAEKLIGVEGWTVKPLVKALKEHVTPPVVPASKAEPVAWISKSRWERMIDAEPWLTNIVYSEDQSQYFDCVPLYSTPPAAPVRETPAPALDWSNFEGPKRNVEWKPDDQDLIYTAINYRDDEYGDADEDVGQQLVERLLAAWRSSVISEQLTFEISARLLKERDEAHAALSASPSPVDSRDGLITDAMVKAYKEAYLKHCDDALNGRIPRAEDFTFEASRKGIAAALAAKEQQP